eukprot:s7133_g1.t1
MHISYYDIQNDVDYILTWLNSVSMDISTGESSSSQQAPTRAPLVQAAQQLGQALQGVQSEPGRGDHCILLATMMFLLAIHAGPGEEISTRPRVPPGKRTKGQQDKGDSPCP